jgi:HD-GYP domain-containing protein (c-di-GMP phosphodiesterase class II)
MKKVPLASLEAEKMLSGYICHTSGEVLHNPGDVLKLEHIVLMEESGISEVVLLEINENPDDYKSEVTLKRVSIEDITAGEECPVTLLDATNAVVVEAGQVIAPQLLSELQEKDVTELRYERDSQELETFQCTKYRLLLESAMFESIGDVTVLEHPAERDRRESAARRLEVRQTEVPGGFDIKRVKISEALLFNNPVTDVSASNLKEAMKDPQNLRSKPLPEPLALLAARVVIERTAAAKDTYIKKYRTWIETLQEIFATLKSNQQVPLEKVEALAKAIVAVYVEDSLFCLNLVNMKADPAAETYVGSHCVNVCILSIGMAAYAGFNPEQVVEIAIAALLHDAGHVITYKPLFKLETLDTTEQQKFDQHVMIGLAMLKNITKIPKSTAFVIYQHHERLNGSGRILHCTADKIHDFAKLIAVADEFELISRRKHPCRAIAALMPMVKAQLIDKEYLKAVLLALSLYPLGSYVRVTGNKVCKVIATNGENFKLPVVVSLYSYENGNIFNVDQTETIDLLTHKDISIVEDIVHPMLVKQVAAGF